jgi:hypothetical protein
MSIKNTARKVVKFLEVHLKSKCSLDDFIDETRLGFDLENDHKGQFTFIIKFWNLKWKNR